MLCDSLNCGITKEAAEGDPKRSPRHPKGWSVAERRSNRMIVKLIGWAGNLTCSGSQFQGVLIA